MDEHHHHHNDNNGFGNDNIDNNIDNLQTSSSNTVPSSNVRNKFGTWMTDFVYEMKRKSPSVQKWVDSLPISSSLSGTTEVTTVTSSTSSSSSFSLPSPTVTTTTTTTTSNLNVTTAITLPNILEIVTENENVISVESTELMDDRSITNDYDNDNDNANDVVDDDDGEITAIQQIKLNSRNNSLTEDLKNNTTDLMTGNSQMIDIHNNNNNNNENENCNKQKENLPMKKSTIDEKNETINNNNNNNNNKLLNFLYKKSSSVLNKSPTTITTSTASSSPPSNLNSIQITPPPSDQSGKYVSSASTTETSSLVDVSQLPMDHNHNHNQNQNPSTQKRNLLSVGNLTTFGKSKINEFYDKINLNKRKYNLMIRTRQKMDNIKNDNKDEIEQQQQQQQIETINEQQQQQQENLNKENINCDNEFLIIQSNTINNNIIENRKPHSNDDKLNTINDMDISTTDDLSQSIDNFSGDDSFSISTQSIDDCGPPSSSLSCAIGGISGSSTSYYCGGGGGGGGGNCHNQNNGVNHQQQEQRNRYLNISRKIGIGEIGRSTSDNPRLSRNKFHLNDIGRSFSENQDDVHDDVDNVNGIICIGSGNTKSSSIPIIRNITTNNNNNNSSSEDININNSNTNANNNNSDKNNKYMNDNYLERRAYSVSPVLRSDSLILLTQEQRSSLTENLRNKNVLLRDSSIQSDSSHCSSVESLLESRKPDPEAILRNLGFGPVEDDDVLARIPKRFLRPSQVRGNDTEHFIKQQQMANNLYEQSILGYRGLVGNPHIPPSQIVAKIMERFQVNDGGKRYSTYDLASLASAYHHHHHHHHHHHQQLKHRPSSAPPIPPKMIE